MRPVIRNRAPSIYDRPAGKRQIRRKVDPIFDTSDIRGSGKADLYGLWRGDLIADWGKYCSYCEIPLGTSLQVEHKDPKSAPQDFYALVMKNVEAREVPGLEPNYLMMSQGGPGTPQTREPKGHHSTLEQPAHRSDCRRIGQQRRRRHSGRPENVFRAWCLWIDRRDLRRRGNSRESFAG